MPRETPIDPSWPLASFASGLRALREKRRITYRQMARLTNYGPTVLCVAARGLHLPTWEVTAAYVWVCDGPVAEWHLRWIEAQNLARPRRNGLHHA
jgi:hypothetical protein